MIVVIAWSFAGVAILLAGALLALGIELGRRDYRDRARLAETGAAVVALQPPAAEVEAASLRAA